MLHSGGYPNLKQSQRNSVHRAGWSNEKNVDPVAGPTTTSACTAEAEIDLSELCTHNLHRLDGTRPYRVPGLGNSHSRLLGIRDQRVVIW